jgi:hypothetical protein
MSIFSKLFRTTKTTTVNDPLRIPHPTIGFLNLQGDRGAALLESDRRAISPHFTSTKTSTDVAPKSDVLFLYCSVDTNGKVIGYDKSIRDYIKEANAYIAVVAAENSGDSYFKAVNRRNSWSANIVLIINRREEKFPVFFQRLFQAMLNGTTMLMAWVELAPQIPGDDHPDCPEAIMLAEAGHITFK